MGCCMLCQPADHICSAAMADGHLLAASTWHGRRAGCALHWTVAVLSFTWGTLWTRAQQLSRTLQGMSRLARAQVFTASQVAFYSTVARPLKPKGMPACCRCVKAAQHRPRMLRRDVGFMFDLFDSRCTPSQALTYMFLFNSVYILCSSLPKTLYQVCRPCPWHVQRQNISSARGACARQ